jgi:hypothetical protein
MFFDRRTKFKKLPVAQPAVKNIKIQTVVGKNMGRPRKSPVTKGAQKPVPVTPPRKGRKKNTIADPIKAVVVDSSDSSEESEAVDIDTSDFIDEDDDEDEDEDEDEDDDEDDNEDEKGDDDDDDDDVDEDDKSNENGNEIDDVEDVHNEELSVASDDEVVVVKTRSRSAARKKATAKKSTTQSKPKKVGKKRSTTGRGKTVSQTTTVKKPAVRGRKGRPPGKKTKPASASASLNQTASGVKDLASFGITPAKTVDAKVGKERVPNTSALRVVIIPGIDSHCDLVFRCEPTGLGNQNSSWCEKLLADAIREPKSWAKKLNFSVQTYNWYDQNIIQLNRNGYPIRLFHIPVSLPRTEITDNLLLELCKHICTMLTSTPRNTESISCQDGVHSWHQGDIVWADVIGKEKALSMVRFLKGNAYQGFYEAHEQFLLTYFKRNDEVLDSQYFRNRKNEHGEVNDSDENDGDDNDDEDD